MNSRFSRPSSFAAFGGALRAQRESLRMTLDGLAAATGISKPYLSNIETARAPGPPLEDKLRRLARALQVPTEELLAGADWLRTPASVRKAVEQGSAPRREDGAIDLDALMEKRGQTGRRQAKRQEVAGEIGVRAVPLINKVPAGQAHEFGDMGYPAGVADAYVPAPDLPDTTVRGMFAVRVTGDSMWPEYKEGEILIVGPGEAKDGEDCIVRLGELEQFATTFKRIYWVKDGEEVKGVRLVPLNRAHAERTVGLEEVTGVYPLVYRLIEARGAGGAASNVPISVAEPAEERSFTSRVSIEHD